jgi:hypothetical protein
MRIVPARTVAVFVAGLVVATSAARPAIACSCGSETLEDAIDRADFVFRGELIERGPDCEYSCYWDGDGWDLAVVPFTYDVAEVWKGDVPADAMVVAYVDQCGGAPPVVGTEHLVFAREDDVTGHRVFSRCGGFAGAASMADLDALGEGAAPSAPQAPTFTCAAPFQETEPRDYSAPTECQLAEQREEDGRGIPGGCSSVVAARRPVDAAALVGLAVLAALALRRRGTPA